MQNTSQIDLNINKSTSISIIASQAEIDLNTAVWAVNWFDTKRKWLYNLYTSIASGFVVKAGGSLWFKGELEQTLAGNEKDARKILLIVKYPTANHFLDLVKMKLFQMVSILRILAVKRFVFGFTQRIEIEGLIKNRQPKGALCLVHHFRNDTGINEQVESISHLASDMGIHLNYAGLKAATLKRSHSTEGGYDIPFIMDGIFVFEGENKEQLMAFYQSEAYQIFAGSLDNSYVALFRKLAL